ncbi:MAG: DMT family transporter [Alphaproteobacteria bacterium]|nr:DMT family transporter [Alphaproteobacteria bacterium]
MSMRAWSDHAKGLALGLSGILVLTPDSLLVRLIVADQWTLLFWRGLLTFICMSAFVGVRDGWALPARFVALGPAKGFAAVLFAATTVLFVTSIRHTAVANTLVILSAAPIFAAVLSSLFLREHAPPRTWAAAVAGLGCIVHIVGGSLDGASLVGDGAAVLLSLSLAAYLVILRHARAEDVFVVVAASGLINALVALPFVPTLALSANDWIAMGILGCVVLPVSYALLGAAPKYLPAPEVGLVYLLETVLGPYWVWLVLDEAPPERTLAGGAALIIVVALHAAAGTRRRPAA